jgi:hypothetical protein
MFAAEHHPIFLLGVLRIHQVRPVVGNEQIAIARLRRFLAEPHPTAAAPNLAN